MTILWWNYITSSILHWKFGILNYNNWFSGPKWGSPDSKSPLLFKPCICNHRIQCTNFQNHLTFHIPLPKTKATTNTIQTAHSNPDKPTTSHQNPSATVLPQVWQETLPSHHHPLFWKRHFLPGFELTGVGGLTPRFPCSFHCDPPTLSSCCAADPPSSFFIIRTLLSSTLR